LIARSIISRNRANRQEDTIILAGEPAPWARAQSGGRFAPTCTNALHGRIAHDVTKNRNDSYRASPRDNLRSPFQWVSPTTRHCGAVRAAANQPFVKWPDSRVPGSRL